MASVQHERRGAETTAESSAVRSADRVTLLRTDSMPKDLVMHNIDVFPPDDVKRLPGTSAKGSTSAAFLSPA